MPSSLTFRRFVVGAASLSLVFGVSTACSSSSDTTTSTASDTAATDTGGDSTAAGTLNANTATEDELKAAFATAGIPNGEKWADEIAEYRPFDNIDQVHEKLKEYNISNDSWAMLSKLITV